MKHSKTTLIIALMTLTLMARAEHRHEVDTVALRHALSVADSLERQHNILYALTWYEEAMRIAPIPQTKRKVASCQYRRGHYKDCIELLSTIEPDSVGYEDMKALFNCYLQLSASDSVLAWGNRILDIQPYEGDVVAKLAHYNNNRERPDSALLYTTAYYERDSTNIFVNRQQAFALYKNGSFKEALHEYLRLQAMGDRNESLYYYMGLCYVQTDSAMQAFNAFKEAAQLGDFKNANIVAQLGMSAIDIGLANEGIDYINRAITLMEPDKRVMHALVSSIAEGYFNKRDYAQCIKYLKQCVEYDSESPYVLFRIAQAYGKMDNWQKEKEYYKLFIEKAEKMPSTEILVRYIGYARESILHIDEENFFKGVKE